MTIMELRHTGSEVLDWRTVSDLRCTKTQRILTDPVYQPNPAAMNTRPCPASMTRRDPGRSLSRCRDTSWVLMSRAVTSISIQRRTSIIPRSKPTWLAARVRTRFWLNTTISHLTRPSDLRWKLWFLPSRRRTPSAGHLQRIMDAKSSIHAWGPQGTGSVTFPRSTPMRHRTLLTQTLTGRTRPWLALVALCDVS